MSISRKQQALLHVAKARLDLSEETYRTALAQVAGVTSSAELDQDGFTAMMGLFEYLGFSPTKAQGQNFGVRPGMASFAQIELIRVLWAEYTHTGSMTARCSSTNGWSDRSRSRPCASSPRPMRARRSRPSRG